MHTVSLNPIQYSNKNNPAELSFKGTFALPSGVTFDEDKKSIFNFSKRYEEIKKYNPKKDSIKKLKHLNDEDFQKVIGAINKVPKRKMALLNKRADFDFSKSTAEFNGIKDSLMGLSFSNGYGFHNIFETSNIFGDLHVSRETSNIDSKNVTTFIDKSRFNEDYFVESIYCEAIDYAKDCKTAKSRKISIKDYDLNPVLNYEYSRKSVQNSDYCEYNVNGRIYNAKFCKNGKIALTSGTKGEVLDFSKVMEKFSENKREKETFAEALKLLPPQVLLELNETLGAISKDDKRFCLYTPSVAANSMIDLTIERLSEENNLSADKELLEIFDEEKENFTKWLKANSDGHLRMGQQAYIKDYLNPDKEILEVIKSVCNLLWMEEYEEGKASDEGKRLLLNFFPETVNFIVSRFELNSARLAA